MSLKLLLLAVRVKAWRAFVLAMAAIIGILPSCSRIRPAAIPPLPLLIEPAMLDLKSVSPGARVTSKVTVRNLTVEPLTLRWRSSCECVTVTPAVLVAKPGNQCPLLVTIDVDDDVTGSFAVNIMGETLAGEELSGFVVRYATTDAHIISSLEQLP